MTGWQHISHKLTSYQIKIENALVELRDEKVMARIWARDHTVWKPEPAEITNRLGWLNTPEKMVGNIKRLEALADDVRDNGYTDVLLLGMGGSSLAPEVFQKTFGVKKGYLNLAVLDSTDPGAILAHAECLDPARTLFIVSTKSGTTVETLSFFKFFYNWVKNSLGEKRAGENFIAITDPGSPLTELARRCHFRECFLNDPNIGGRYSALSYFGLVPAALIGMDIQTLLERAITMMRDCEPSNCPVAGSNHGGKLGVVLGELAKAGRDKATIISSPGIVSFGDWVEQLIAESTGKEGKGILPVVGERTGSPAFYGDDRLFVSLRIDGDETNNRLLKDMENAGHPVLYISLHDTYDIGGQFFLWEMATAVAGYRLGINPFDQPDVETSKILARKIADEYREKGSLPDEKSAFNGEVMAVYGEIKADSPESALEAFLDKTKPGAYIALQAYLQPTSEMGALLQIFRTSLRERYRLATTVGYGPRFLHSTGQLHKGDAGHGLFIQFTTNDSRDVPIPEEAGSSDSSITFGVLKAAQALGDRQALIDRGRKVIRFHFKRDPIDGLKRLAEVLK